MGTVNAAMPQTFPDNLTQTWKFNVGDAIGVGDLMYDYASGDKARPADKQASQASEAADQILFASVFCGVSQQQILSSETNTNKEFTVRTEGLFTFNCVSNTFVKGDLVGVYSDGVNSPDAQKLDKVTTTDKAIGFVVKAYSSATTRVRVYLIARNYTAMKAFSGSTFGDIILNSATGGDSSLDIAGKVGTASVGGSLNLAGGAGAGAGNAGGAVTALGGTGVTTGAGGAITLTGGTGGVAGAGGAVAFTGGVPTSGNAAGGAGSLIGGAGSGTGAGGAVTITGGASGTGATGNGGAILATAGAATSTNGTGGASSLIGGLGTGTGVGGAVALTGGLAGATNAVGGAATVTAGAGQGTGAGAVASMVGGASGAGATGNGGVAKVVAGAAASTNGTGGAAQVTGGLATGTGTGGAVTITAGASGGAGGTAGSVTINSGAAAGGTAGTVTINSGVAPAAGGSAQAALLCTSTASLGVYFGTGAPTFSAAKGSLYCKTDAATSATRLYVASDAVGTWTAYTSAA